MQDINYSLNHFILLAHKYWLKPLGLIISCIISILLVTAICAVIKPNKYVIVSLYLLPCLIIVFSWFYSRRYPKTKKYKIGFVVSITCSSEEDRIKIREDLIISLKELLKRGRTGKSFQFIIIPEHIAEKVIDADDAHDLRRKCKAHFILYGRVRVRDIQGKAHHVLNLEGLVGHRPLPSQVSQLLSKEFAELLPRRVHIAPENDLFLFEFTSEWIDHVSRYIIGTASVLSGDLDYAEALYNDLNEMLNSKEGSFPIFIKLKDRIPLRLSEIYEARARFEYELWLKDHDDQHLDQVGMYLDKIIPRLKDHYRIRLNRSVYLFLKYREVDAYSADSAM